MVPEILFLPIKASVITIDPAGKQLDIDTRAAYEQLLRQSSEL